MSFEVIPNEIIEHVLSFTAIYSGMASRVSTLWYDLIKDRDKYIRVKSLSSLKLAIWGSKNIHGFSWYKTCSFAVKKGRLSILRYAYEKKHLFPDTIAWKKFWKNFVVDATSRGQLKMIKWVDGHIQLYWNRKALYYAAECNHLKTLKWLWPQVVSIKSLYSRNHIDTLYNYACHDKGVKIMKWIYAQGYSPSCYLLLEAICKEYEDVIRWARTEIYPPCHWNSRLLSYTMADNNKEFLLKMEGLGYIDLDEYIKKGPITIHHSDW